MVAEKSLLTADHRDALDIVDSLRSKGIGRYVDLPQIIVCGDQSSGKSSVLEAISGLSFPTKDGLCTRFATELILRRSASSASGLKISITPGPDRDEKDRKKLQAFGYNTENAAPNLGEIIEVAQKLMGLDGSSHVFSKDILRVEISSPDQPHLTLVDLPGLFLAGNKGQSIEDAKLVKSLVMSYMKQPRSIILAVVSAKSEFALQQVTERAREADPKGTRTLGLITKPDTLDSGSEGEHAYLELARNKDVQFRLGWHVVKNRDFKTRDCSKAERDASERDFFSTGVWASLNPMHRGVDALVVRLSKVLHDHNIAQLPQVLKDIESGMSDCSHRLQKLGKPRETPAQQRQYLLRASQVFTGLVVAAVEGMYRDRSFFGDLSSRSGDKRRLRALVQNSLDEFAQAMRTDGHTQYISGDATLSGTEEEDTEEGDTEEGDTEEGDTEEGDTEEEDTEEEDTEEEDTEEEEANGNGVSQENDSSSSQQLTVNVAEGITPRVVTRAEAADRVKRMMRINRGRELPGTFNPLLIGELFVEQCKPWETLSQRQVDYVLSTAHAVLRDAIGFSTDEGTAGRLMSDIVNPAVGDMTRAVQTKLDELLEPHISGHPITYNHYLTENMQKAQLRRQEMKINAALNRHTQHRQSKHSGMKLDANSVVIRDVDAFRRSLVVATELNMDDFAATTAIDTMEAYYKVAMKKFVDDVSILAVEQCIMKKLPGIFSPDVVCRLSDAEFACLAGESSESVEQRKWLSEKLKVLEDCYMRLGELAKGRGIAVTGTALRRPDF